MPAYFARDAPIRGTNVQPGRALEGKEIRILGYVLLAAGILFLVLFTFAQFGGAHLGILPWLISLFLVSMGWSFARSGKGLVQPSAAGPTADAVTYTVALPMSPGAAAVIKRQADRSRRIPLYIGGGCFALFLLVGIALATVDHAAGEGGSLFAIFALTGALTGVLIIVISLIAARPYGRDITATTFLRTTGPIEVEATGFGGIGAILRLADRAFLINLPGERAAFAGLNDGTVDYSPHGHVILAVWDSQQRIVYSAPGYEIKSSPENVLGA
jgi:hypothetical protein